MCIRDRFNMQQEGKDTDIYKGLTFWAPNVNIFRDPRWGVSLIHIYLRGADVSFLPAVEDLDGKYFANGDVYKRQLQE